MLIADLLRPEQIALDLKSTTGGNAIHEVASLLRSHPAVTAFDKFYEVLLAREQLESTCLGDGIALPHARSAHIKEMVLAVGRSAGGIAFSGSKEPIRLLFVIGTPQRMANEYLSVVGGLARVLKEERLRQQLLAAPDAQAFIDILALAEKKF